MLDEARALLDGFCLGLVESLGIQCDGHGGGDDVLGVAKLATTSATQSAHAAERASVLTAPPTVQASATPTSLSCSAIDGKTSHARLLTSSPAALRSSHVPVWSCSFVLMPAWQLLQRDVPLWKAMRKTLRANLFVASFALAALIPALLPEARHAAREAQPIARRARHGVSLHWVVRWVAVVVQLGGQWPLYVTFQVVGLLWYYQLYLETWMLRKGLYITRGATQEAAIGTGPPQGRSAQARLWQGDGESGTTLAVALRAVMKRCGTLCIQLLRRKLPPAPEAEWVVGDKRRFAATRLQAPRDVEAHIHAASESLFKFCAALLFSWLAVLIEWGVPWCGLGRLIGFALNCFLYTFYVFDYRYTSQYSARGERMTLTDELAHYELRWAYNVGYGVPATALSYLIAPWTGSVAAMCVVSIVYAWQVVCSGFAHPRLAPCALPLLTPWFCLVDTARLLSSVAWRVAVLYFLYRTLRYGIYLLRQ